jgi:hypothetical protein
MPRAPANPDLLLQRHVWRNRIALWRAQAGQTAFNALALLAFVGFGLLIADPHWTALLRSDARWAQPLPAAVLALTLATLQLLRGRAQRRALASSERDDWLAALPIEPALRQHARRRRVALASALSTIGMVALIAWAAARAEQPAIALLGALLAGAALGSIGVWLIPEGGTPRTSVARTRAAAVNIASGTRGLALLGAALEPAVARLPRGAPWVAGSFMLLPPSTPLIAIPGLFVLFTAASLLVDLIAHWRARYLADQIWLAAQPLPAARLLGAYLVPLARRATLLCLIVGACLHALGAPLIFSTLLALATWLLFADAVLCAFATRRAPWQFPMLLMLHGAALLASLQVLPPALPLVLLGCGLSAWRRGLR